MKISMMMNADAITTTIIITMTTIVAADMTITTMTMTAIAVTTITNVYKKNLPFGRFFYFSD